MKKTMAYKSKGKKLPKADMTAPKLDPSAAPSVSPGRNHKDPSGPWNRPQGGCAEGEQSAAPRNKGITIPTKDAPAGVKGVNAGDSVTLPKSGGVGEGEV